MSAIQFLSGVVSARVLLRAIGTSALLLLAAAQTQAAWLKCAIRVETVPANTTVEALLIPVKQDAKRILPNTSSQPGQGNGWETGVFKFLEGDSVRIAASAANYEPTTKTVSFAELKSGGASDKNPWVVRVSLETLRVEFPVGFVGGSDAKFFVNDKPVDATTALVFTRDNARSPWQPLTVRAERPQHKTLEKPYSKEQIEALPQINGRPQVSLELDEIERQIKLTVQANETNATVLLDDKPVTNTTAQITLTFTRASGDQPWPEHRLRVEKEGYEHRPAGLTIGLRAYETNLTYEAVQALSNQLNLVDFQPVRFFEVPMHRFVASNGVVLLEVTNSTSAKDHKENSVEKLLQFSRNTRGESLVVGRMDAILLPNAQGKPGEIVIALLSTNPRINQPTEIRGSQIWRLTAAGVGSQITVDDPGVFNTDPCITKDGKTVYFSSNRRGQRSIWKKPATTGGAQFQIDAGKGVDVEPAVFTTSEGITRVAFTRYLPGAAVGTLPIIVVQDEAGQSCAETQPGRSPSWSSDGTKIAYVSPRNRICVMDSTGEHVREITSGSSIDDSPAWLPGNRDIVYARTEYARGGTGNYDLWRVDLDGANPQQLISNPSFDGMPAVTSEPVLEDGKDRQVTYIYFLSNRGAQKEGEECWTIRYFELR